MNDKIKLNTTPRKIIGLDETKLVAEQAKIFDAGKATRFVDFIDSIFSKQGQDLIFDPTKVLESWAEWIEIVKVLHRCTSIQNQIPCTATDECTNYTEEFPLPITFGGSPEPMMGDEILRN